MKKDIKELLIIETCIILITILVKFYIEIIGYFPKCYFMQTFGVFCPSCNFTRCIIELSNLDILGAFNYHPILTIGLIYLFIVNIIYIINTLTNKKILQKLYPKTWHIIVFTILLVIYAIYKNVIA